MEKGMFNNTSGVSKDQLITVKDLEIFKDILINEFTLLLKKVGDESIKKWLKSSEVSKMLKMSPGKLLTLRNNGTLPYTQIGGNVYYHADDIQKMFELHKRCNK